MPTLALNMLSVETATIASGASMTGAINLNGWRLFGISMPASWTAASLTFQGSFDGGATWQNLYDSSGNEITLTTAASRYVAIDPLLFLAVPMMKVRSGTASGGVNQAQDSQLSLILRSV